MVSVIVPTHNRRADLRDAIHSLLGQDYPRFEIIVVESNCTDGTWEMVEDIAMQTPRLRHVQEEGPGVNAARNRGSHEAQAELLAFFDDDEIAPHQWLSQLVAAQVETGAGAVGGPYEPLWQAPPPRWLLRSRCMQETLSFVDFGTVRREVEWLLGGNALYTRQALKDANYYGVRPGRTGLGKMVGGGDMSAGARVRRAGHRIWFEPSAIVYHKVPPERMQLSYIMRRAFWAGYNDVVLGREWKLLEKARRASGRGADAIALGLMILPGVLWGRCMTLMGCLQPGIE